MHIGKKKITISALIVVVFVSVIVWAATSYPNAAISFSGIKMVANGSTTQGFVDISLKNIDSTAISYCIEYDKNYIELSDVATNTPIKNPTTSSGSVGYSYDIAHDYFELELSSQMQRYIKINFKRRFPVQAFAWTLI